MIKKDLDYDKYEEELIVSDNGDFPLNDKKHNELLREHIEKSNKLFDDLFDELWEDYQKKKIDNKK